MFKKADADFVYRTSQPKVLHKKYSEKTRKIHRKLTAIVYLFSRMAGLQPANLLPQEHHRWRFSVNIIIFFRVVSLKTRVITLCVFLFVCVCVCLCVCGVCMRARTRECLGKLSTHDQSLQINNARMCGYIIRYFDVSIR